MKKIIFKIIATIIFAILTLVFGVGGLFGIIWVIKFFNIPVYVFVPILTILFLWCIYKEIFGGDTMTKTKEFKFRLTEKEFEEMQELAEQEGRTMSNLLRYLVSKERKEREK